MQSKKKKINVLSRNVDQANRPSTLFFTLALLIGTAFFYGCGQDINNEQAANEELSQATEAAQHLEYEEEEDSVVRIPCLNPEESEPCQHNPDFHGLSGEYQETLMKRGLDSVAYASLVLALDLNGATVCIGSGGQPFLATLDNGSCGTGACVPPMAPESEPTPTPDPDDTMTTFSANEICPSKFNNEPVTFVLPPYNLSDDDIARLLPAGNSLEETCELANWKCTNFGGNTMVTTYSNMLDENQINLLPRTVEEGTSFNTVENAILIIHQSTDSE